MRHRIRARLADPPDGDHDDSPVLEIEPGELSRVFVARAWLRDAGVVAWLLLGIVAVLVGTVYLLGLTSSIFVPVVTATMIAAVVAPLVAWMQTNAIPRGASAALMLSLIVVVGVPQG